MPDLSMSIEIDGRYFCWDERTDEVYEIDPKLTPVREPSRLAIKTLIQQKRRGPGENPNA